MNLRRIELSIGFRGDSEITATGLFYVDQSSTTGGIPVAQSTIRGQAGQVVQAVLEFDAMNAIKFSAGPAALVELCFVPVPQDARKGWEPGTLEEAARHAASWFEKYLEE
jgi:hypothetical protein